MSLDYIAKSYGVPAKKGQRIRFTFRGDRLGTVLGARGSNLKIRLDGDKHYGLYHPTWELEYLSVGQPEGES